MTTTAAPQPVATLAKDVDIFADPGDNGTAIGILRRHRQVKLVGTCKPIDWCEVVLPELPAGSGWVWSEFPTLKAIVTAAVWSNRTTSPLRRISRAGGWWLVARCSAPVCVEVW